jgi:glycosyltransferase involved in cell wall biosynthesis
MSGISRGRRVKIAQVAPLFESVPPRGYGGTERVVSYLTEELVRRGHEVTLFASGDSRTSARLIAACPHSLRLDPSCKISLPHHLMLLEKVSQCAQEFDLIHYHIDCIHFPVIRRVTQRQLTTLHGRLDVPDLEPFYCEYSEMPLVSVSDSQRQPLEGANWLATVYHGLPRDLYSFQEKPGSYFAFLGRMSPEKGCDQAIDISRATGIPLKIAAKVGLADRPYFDAVLRPRLREPGIDYIGEIGEEEKGAFLGGARALLFPISWPEPFGLVMIESLACGTPVLAFRSGSVPEILEEGVTGFIGGSVGDLVRSADRIESLDRRECRRAFERRFSDFRMVEDYLQVYHQVVHGEPACKK